MFHLRGGDIDGITRVTGNSRFRYSGHTSAVIVRNTPAEIAYFNMLSAVAVMAGSVAMGSVRSTVRCSNT